MCHNRRTCSFWFSIQIPPPKKKRTTTHTYNGPLKNACQNGTPKRPLFAQLAQKKNQEDELRSGQGGPEIPLLGAGISPNWDNPSRVRSKARGCPARWSSRILEIPKPKPDRPCDMEGRNRGIARRKTRQTIAQIPWVSEVPFLNHMCVRCHVGG